MSISKDLIERYKSQVFIETGSYEGDTIQKALDVGVIEVHSIEINPEKYRYCCNRFKGDTRVHLYLGDTIDTLSSIVSMLQAPATFWLDAHAGNGASGKKPCPLIQELSIIQLQSPTIRSHTLLIDDRRLMGSAAWGFVTEAQVISGVLNINPSYKIRYEGGVIPNDIIVAII